MVRSKWRQTYLDIRQYQRKSDSLPLYDMQRRNNYKNTKKVKEYNNNNFRKKNNQSVHKKNIIIIPKNKTKHIGRKFDEGLSHYRLQSARAAGR